MAERQDLNIANFMPSTDTEETAEVWKAWIKMLIRKVRFFKIKDNDDRLLALQIYGGEVIDELIETLEQPPDNDVVHLPKEWGILKLKDDGSAGEAITDFHRALYKLNKHFSLSSNKDAARSAFECMKQGDLTMAKYYVQLKKQADKCQFADRDDTIRTRILQTMSDKKLRREAMMKNYTLQELLKHAAIKEDVERQASAMEKEEESVKKIYEERRTGSRPIANRERQYKGQPEGTQSQQYNGGQSQRSRYTREARETNSDECGYCGYKHNGGRNMCPAAGQECRQCHRKGHFKQVCRNKPQYARHVGDEASSETAVSTHEDSDSDFSFAISSSGHQRPTVKVAINGVKGKMDADSCSSANVMDEKQFSTIVSSSSVPIKLHPVDRELFAYAQNKPIRLVGKFYGTITSISTGKSTEAEFLVIKGTANSRPLLSLDTSLKLEVLHVTHRIEAPPVNYQEVFKKFPNAPKPRNPEKIRYCSSMRVPNKAETYDRVY